MHHAFENPQRLLNTIRSEEYPRYINENKRSKCLIQSMAKRLSVKHKHFYHAVTHRPKRIARNLIKPVKQTPYNKRPLSTMPQTTDKEHNQQIEILSCLSLSASSQRNIQVIPEPTGQADMPSSPEFRYRTGKIRRVKVLHQAESHDLCCAPGDR